MVQIVAGIVGVVAVAAFGWTGIRLAPYSAPWSPPWRIGPFDGRWPVMNAAIRLAILGGVTALVAWQPYVRGTPTVFTTMGYGWGWFPKPSHSSVDQQWIWIVVAVAGLISAGFLIAWFVPLRRHHQGSANVHASAADSEPTLSDLTDGALQAMMSERDPRRAILACYAQMERALAIRGIPRNPEETALEYARRLLERAGAPRDPLRSLTALFDAAGFSAQPMDEAMRETAISSLRAISASAL